MPDRIRAAVIDGLVTLVIFVSAGVLVSATGLPGWLGALFGFGGLIAYEPIMLRLRFATIGHEKRGIEVIAIRGGGALPLANGVLRILVKSVFGAISLLMIYDSPRRQALHDALSGSLVVREGLSAAERQRAIEQGR